MTYIRVNQFWRMTNSARLQKCDLMSARLMSSTCSSKALSMDNLNPAIKEVEYAVRGPLPIRANEIQKELNEGNTESYPFDKIIKANIGDCHATGGRFISYIRQVLSVCTCPSLESSSLFLPDVVKRAKRIRENCGPGQSLGSYSESSGIDVLRKDVAEYISKRDEISANFENVFACTGASAGIRTILKLMVADKRDPPSGVMIPIPQYPLYSAALAEYGMKQIGYYLDEELHWAITTDELIRAYDAAKGDCVPRAIVIINPGNPTGQLLSEQNIKDVVMFARDRNLVVLADEVYQDNVHNENERFVSFRKVVLSMNDPYNKTELASFHSASKGFMGECGARGGYFEINNFDPDVIVQLKKLISTNLCPPVWGQVVMDLIVKPPSVDDQSYDLYIQEKQHNLHELSNKAHMVSKLLNEINGISCNAIKGAMYAFPKIDLPQKFIDSCKKDNKAPDAVYCMKLLESTGICVVPGSGFGQKEGTYHFRMTILPSASDMVILLSHLKKFHEKLLKENK